MAVIPTTSVLRRPEGICKLVSGSNWTLCDSWNTIRLKGVFLLYTMPVYRRAIERQVVVHRNVQSLRTFNQILETTKCKI